MVSSSEKSELVTDIMLETFRLNGTLLAQGDMLVADLGLTSARWQVLGAIALEGRPITVAQIGRRMGLTRQSVQRVVTDLAAAGFLAFADNPDHKRAKLVGLTDKGEAAYREADKRQTRWSEEIAKAMESDALATSLRVLREIGARSESRDM